MGARLVLMAALKTEADDVDPALEGLLGEDAAGLSPTNSHGLPPAGRKNTRRFADTTKLL
jgi:hypothetical protein